MVNRILLNSRAGGGKDTFGDYLVSEHGFKKITFADGIYEIAYKYFGMKHKDRALLQKIGQKMREIDPMVWVNLAFSEASKYEKVVLTDCRQLNEYAIGLQKGFLPINIEADLDVRVKRLEDRDGFYPDLSLLENDSETGADGMEFVYVDNNRSVEELYKSIDSLLTEDWSGVLRDMQMEFTLKQMY